MLHARADYQRIQDPDNKIPEDEPVLLIRGQDAIAPHVLAYYADYLESLKGDQNIIKAVRLHIDRMIRWQTKKMPNMDSKDIVE